MPRPIQTLLEEISREHFPHPPAAPVDIEMFERRVGWHLDSDLRAFYLHCNGAELFKRLPDAPYRILPLTEISRARVAIYGEDDDRWGPSSMYTLCDVQDGDYVLVDVASEENGRYPCTDGYREAWPNPDYCERISRCFSEFLEKALSSQGRLFYLK